MIKTPISQEQEQEQQQQQQPSQSHQQVVQEQQETSSQTFARSNYHVESEQSVNELINILLNGCYECHAMMYFFKRDDVALFGLADFHELLAQKQHDLAKKLMNYQILRGARVNYGPIKAPKPESEWDDSLKSLQCCLEKFKSHNEHFVKVYCLSEDKNDPHLSNFVQHELTHCANEIICLIAKKITKLKRAGSGLGEYDFDRDLRVWLYDNFPEYINPESKAHKLTAGKVYPPTGNVRNIGRRVVEELDDVIRRFKNM